jgi:hypothetical protein
VPFDKIKFSNEPVKTTSASSGSTGAGGSASSGMTTGAATSGGSAGGAAGAALAKPNPWYPDHAVMSGASKDQLKAMPEFKYST